MNKPRNKSYSIMFDIIKGNKIMQRSNEQVTPKRDLLPPWSPPPGPCCSQHCCCVPPLYRN